MLRGRPENRVLQSQDPPTGILRRSTGLNYYQILQYSCEFLFNRPYVAYHRFAYLNPCGLVLYWTVRTVGKTFSLLYGHLDQSFFGKRTSPHPGERLRLTIFYFCNVK
jgi:hypothetical protein